MILAAFDVYRMHKHSALGYPVLTIFLALQLTLSPSENSNYFWRGLTLPVQEDCKVFRSRDCAFCLHCLLPFLCPWLKKVIIQSRGVLPEKDARAHCGVFPSFMIFCDQLTSLDPLSHKVSTKLIKVF